MAFFTDITDRISAMRDLVGDVAQAEELPSSIGGLDDAAVVTLLQQATELVRAAEQVSLVAAGVITRRSQRTAGHSGLAQSRGHRNSASLIQDITGTSKADAARQSRVGESLLASEENPKDDSQGNDSQGD
ncbi:MAG: HNH endonuclease signature motif containing protein, partial [Microbacteriaceae bacterium]